MARCLFCNTPIKNKRSDAIFCSDSHKVKYHRNRNKIDTDNSDKIILSLCDYSGAWSIPYREAGYDVVQIDLKLGQDVRLLKLPSRVYGILAAPPCTHFAISGAVHCKKKGNGALLEGLEIVGACSRLVLFCKPKFWVFENPVGRLKDYIGEPQWRFDPCDYGDAYTKKTCLWGVFNTPKPVNCIDPIKAPSGHHSMDKWILTQGGKLGKDRAALRSITPRGFAQAFFEANQ